MASLLDLMIMRQNPMGAGLLGIGGPDPQDGKSQAGGLVRAASQVRAPSFGGSVSGGAAVPDSGTGVPDEGTGGGGGFLQRLFAGGNAEGLSPEQNAEIRRKAMLISGLHTLANVGEKGLRAVPEGIIAGQSVAEKAKIVAEKRAKEARRAELLSGIDLTDPEQQATAIRDALAQGDVDTARTIADFTISAPKPVELDTVDTGSEIELYDPVTGETVRVITKDEMRNGFVQADDGESILLLDKDTGQTIRRIPKTITDGDDKMFERSDALADDYRSETADFRDVANSIAVGLRSEPNAAGDLTLLSSLLRAQDPGATVRQADIENGKQIGGIPAKYQEWVNRFAAEGKMPDNVREIVRQELIRIGSERRAALQPTMQRFTDQALQVGANPEFVVFDPYADIGVPLPEGTGDPIDELGGLGN